MRIHLNVVRGREAPQVLELDAASVDDARQRAQQDGYAVLAAHAQGAWLSTLARPRAARAQAELPVFLEQLQSLLVAGLSVIEALTTLQRGARPHWEPTLRTLVRQLREGRTLSDVLAAQPSLFPPLLVELVRSAELTSDLPQALGRYLAHHQRVAEVRHRVSSVAVYPALLTGVGSLVILFLLLYVMPRFARVFEGIQGELPWSARLMVAWSHLLDARGPWLLAGLVGAMVALGLAMASPPVRATLLRQALDGPFLRQRLRTYFLARWYRTTGMLVAGGVPLPQAVDMATAVLPATLQGASQAVERGMRQGLAPAAAYAQAGMATPVAEQLLLAGERTGEVGQALERVAGFHEAEVSRALENAMRAFEPLVMTLIGVCVGAVVVLMYLPIFELASAIQ